MKCQNCGADAKGTFCSFCGSQLSQPVSINVTNNYNFSSSQQTEPSTQNIGNCPRCNGTKTTYKRERTSVSSHSSSAGSSRRRTREGQASSQIIYRTVGICQDCGYTWVTDADTVQTYIPTKKRKTWLWVLGWIFIFPIPLTILITRKKSLNSILKAILLIVVWGIYFSMISSKDGTDSGSTELPIRNETAQTIQTTNPPSVFFKESQTPATTITSTPIPTEVSYPIPLYEEGSTKIICWLLDEPVLVSSEMLYNIYTEIDTADPTWQDAAKEVLTFVWNRFGDNQAVIVKLFIDTEDFYKPQTSYQDLIAVWQNNSASNTSQPESEIIWYPNGAGITSDFSSEIWRP